VGSFSTCWIGHTCLDTRPGHSGEDGHLCPCWEMDFWPPLHSANERCKHHAGKMWNGGGIAPCILNISTRHEQLASRFCCQAPVVIAPHTHWLGDWVGPRAGLVVVAVYTAVYWLRYLCFCSLCGKV
jgi:hypothetical protein